jgi:hypothetical protein
MGSQILAFLLLIIVGLISIYAGISGTCGYRRQTYIFPHYYSGGINYASLPGGIMCLLWAFAMMMSFSESWSNFFAILGISFGLLALLFNFIQPNFLTPKWYRWLMENHKVIMPWLREDVAKIGYDEWRQRTDTQEGLEAWVAEVREKNNLTH